MKSLFNSAPIILLILLLGSTRVDAATFVAGEDYSITLPSGWVEIPPEMLDEFEAGLAQASQGAESPDYDYGYQLDSANTWFEYPYILTQVKRTGRIPEGQLTKYEKIAAGFREGMEQTEASFSELISDIEYGETVYDDDNHVLWSAPGIHVEGVGDVRGLIALKLTEFGLIHFAGYAAEDRFEHYAPVFREAVRTLGIAEQDQYRPRLTDHAPVLWGINLGESVLAGLIAGAGGLIIGLIAHVKKKRGTQERTFR